jgi:hypothetical protein
LAEKWDGWKYMNSSTQARFTASYGYLKIGHSESLVSPVRDRHDTMDISIRISQNDCKGTQTATVYWRGSNTIFAQDNSEIAWIPYNGAVNTSYRYLQIRTEV